MGHPPRLSEPGLVLHVFNRGNDGKTIFRDAEDYARFLRFLAAIKKRSPFELFAYCLMPNHFHLLIRLMLADITTIMHALESRYAIHFNKISGSRGHVFQNRFKSPICGNDAYLLELVRYITRNPVPSVAETVDAWPWSSHQDYLRGKGGLSDPQFPLSLFHSDPKTAIGEYLKFVDRETPEAIRKEIESSLDATEAYGRQELEPELPIERTLSDLASETARLSGISVDELRSPSRRRDVCAAREDMIRAALSLGHRPSAVAAFLNRSQALICRTMAKETKIPKRLTPVPVG